MARSIRSALSTITAAAAEQHAPALTEDDGDLLVGLWERVRHAALGEDDDGAVERGAHPGDVGVPEEGAPLPRDGEVVHEAPPRRDRALRHVRRPVVPPRPQLPNAVPASIYMHDFFKMQLCLAR